MLILKQLRKKKKISQSDLADIVGVSLRTIQLYEKENANIPIKNLSKIAEYFEMGIDRLYAKEVNESDIIYDSGNADLGKAHTIRKLGPGKYLLSVPLLVESEQLAHVDKIDDMKYLNTLPQVGFLVNQVSVGKYLAFEILNNSMDNGLVNRIPQKSMVLGKRVAEKELLKKIKDESVQGILICSNTIMCKNITWYNKEKKSILCHSLNGSPEYPDFEVALSEVSEIYKIIKKQVD